MTESESLLSPPRTTLPIPSSRAVRRKRQCHACTFAAAIFVATSVLLFFAAMYERPRYGFLSSHHSKQSDHLLKGHVTAPHSTGSSASHSVKPETNVEDDDASGLPDLPSGAKLVQFQPCPGTQASVPLLVTASSWSGSNATSAYITQHGAANDPDRYFDIMHDLAGDDSISVAPGLFKTNVKPAPDSFYRPDRNIAWQRGKSSWPAGEDAVSPRRGQYALNGAACSSYEVYDALLERFADKERYPNLRTVFLVGHSGGANIVSRYSQVHDDTHDDAYHLRYIVANAAHHAYFTDARPTTGNDNCPAAFKWPYQYASPDKMPRYVKSRFNRVAASRHASKRQYWASQRDLNGARALFERWMQRDVIMLVGDDDTDAGRIRSCSRESQGGSARRDRNYAYWAMQNLVGETGVDVSQFYGYETLKQTGAGSDDQWRTRQSRHRRAYAIAGPGPESSSKHQTKRDSTAHQVCIVQGVGHMPREVYGSQCGLSALRGEAQMASRVGPKD